MKTLIVEDDMMSQCVLAKVLTERGHEVVSYENAEQAILAYQKQFYPLVFVDVGLPGMDGLQFCKWVRAQPNGGKVFMMVATSPGQPGDMGEVLAVGANDFLPKPYEVGALKVRLSIAEKQMKEFFERKELEDALRGSQEGFHRIVKAANEGAWLLNDQFRTDYVNPQMAEVLGYQVEELANRAVIDFLPESAHGEAEQVFGQQRDGKEIKKEFRFRRKDGTECVTFLSAAPVRTESGEFRGSLWMVADLTGRKNLEAELIDTRRKSEGQVRDLTAELNQTRKSLQAESAERKKVEQTLQQSRADLEARLREQSAERGKLADELKAEAAARQKIEGQLANAREELTARVHEFTLELNRTKDALQAEANRRGEGEEALRKLSKELETQIQQQKDELARAAKESKADQVAKKQLEEALQKAGADAELQAKHHAEQSARADKSLQKLQDDLERRLRELTAQLDRTAEELKNENAERRRSEQELAKAREELAHRVKEHTAERLEINKELKAEIAERKRVEEELLKTREDTARRVKEHMAEMVKADDELKGILADRKKVEETLGRARDEVELKVNERSNELARVREQLKTETAERHKFEQNLLKTREELETRLQERVAELARLNHELKQREERLTRASDDLKTEGAARRRVEEALQKTRQELETRVGELSAQLEHSKRELNDRAGQIAGVTEELKARSGALDKANEELQSETAAHKRAALSSAAILKSGQELGAARTPHDAARVIAGVAHELLGWDAFSFDLYSAADNRFVPILNIDTVNGRPAEVPPTCSGPEPIPIMKRVMKEGAQLILRSGPSSSHTDYLLFGDRARLSASMMYVAVRAGNKVVGFLSVHSYAPDAYGQESLDTLQGLADHFGGALERMGAEETQRRSEQRFHLVTRATNDLVWDWNLETGQVWWNEAFQTMFGYKPEEIEPGIESCHSRIHQDDRERVVNGIQSVIKSGVESWSDEYRFRRSDGSYAHVFGRGSVIRNEDQKPIRMVGAMVDVSQRKQTEAAMIEGQARKGAILEAALDAIITIDHEGKVFEWNPAAEKMFGHRRADVLGRELSELIIPPAFRDKHRAGLSGFLAGGEDHGAMVGKRVELKALRADGTEFPIEMTVTRIATDGPAIFTGFIRDITERKQAELEIQKLAAFPRWNPNPVFEFSADGTLTYFNDAARAMAQSLGREHASAILPPNTGGIVKECLAKSECKLRLETNVNGRTITWSFFPIAGNQTVHCYAGDVTERLSLEAQLRQAQKMESIGQLAAGVAHDFNNLLSIVQGYSTLLMEETELKPEMAEALKQIASATDRATHLTRQLLTFGRKQIIHVRNVDLNELINNVGKLLRRAIGESIALQFNYSPSLPAVEADTGMMEQVAMNLAINARDAMPQGGQLTIGTRAIEVDEAYVRHNPEARPGRFVCLTVTDTGVGMDDATLDRIFEPFFTTKSAGKGTGLGLATVYGIVKQHQGWIEVQSQIGQGTTFKVFLPTSSKTVAAPPQNADRPSVRGGSETILLVEDEPAVLTMAKGILQRLGYQVLTAVSGDEAVPVWQQHSAAIGLLLTDMVMPGSLNGRELAEKLLQEKPALKVLYTSGYSMDLVGPGLATSKNFIFLQKPYHPEVLAQTVRQCLDGKLP